MIRHYVLVILTFVLSIILIFHQYFSGPLSVERFPERDDDVDVEQCSDTETQSRSRTPRTPSNNSRSTPQSPSDEERLTPEPVRFNHYI